MIVKRDCSRACDFSFYICWECLSRTQPHLRPITPFSGSLSKSRKRVDQRNRPHLKPITPFSASLSKSSKRIYEMNLPSRSGVGSPLSLQVDWVDFIPSRSPESGCGNFSFHFCHWVIWFRCTKWSCWLMRSEHRAAKAWCAEGTWWDCHCYSKKCHSVGGFM